MFDGGAGWIRGPAGVEAGTVSPCRAQSQRLPAAGVCGLGAGHDGLVVLQPGHAGCGRALDITGEDCGETQHH